jgi:cell division protein FtsW
VGILVGLVPPTKWKRGSKILWILALLGVIAVEFVGTKMNGAQRWIRLGPVNVQPAEFAKVALVVYLAGLLADRKPWQGPKKRLAWHVYLDNVMPRKLARLWPAVWVVLMVGLIEAEPDLGTGAVVAATAFAMFVAGGVSWTSVAVGAVIALLGAGFMAKQQPYRMERIESHVHRWQEQNADGIGFQTVQSEAAMASGGLLGVGFGNGRAKHILPATTTDFIMATIAEETGLLGSALVLGLLGAIVWRLQWLAAQAADRFSSLVLTGVAWWLAIQSCVNVMMANATLPAIGIPLPFFSSGGSSLLALWIAIGICQACVVRKRAPEAEVVVAPDRHGWRNGRTRLSGA